MSFLDMTPEQYVADYLVVTGETLRTTSHIPEPIGVEADCQRIGDAVLEFGVNDFGEWRGNTRVTANLLRGLNVVLNGGRSLADLDTSDPQLKLLQAVVPEVVEIDAHFRAWADLADNVTTNPQVEIIAGRYTGVDGETEMHLDFHASHPSLRYKAYFLGEDNHGSVNCGGDVSLRRNANGTYTPHFGWNAKVEEVPLRKGEIVAEHWAAVHRGPKDDDAIDTNRGVMRVNYDLTKLAEAA